jgi:tetratricopeptide (TPR) repeat protein
MEPGRSGPGLSGPAGRGGSLEKARGHAQAITRLDPVRGGAWEAAILVQEKRFPEAMAACEQALAARPDDYAALFSLGRTVSESGLRLDDGERSLRRCLEMVPAPSEPSHAGVYYRLGLIAELRDDKIAARELYRSSLKLEPTFNRPAEALKRMDQP